LPSCCVVIELIRTVKSHLGYKKYAIHGVQTVHQYSIYRHIWQGL